MKLTLRLWKAVAVFMVSMGWTVTHGIAMECLSFKDGHLNGLQRLTPVFLVQPRLCRHKVLMRKRNSQELANHIKKYKLFPLDNGLTYHIL